MVFHTFIAGEVLSAANVMNDLMNQSVIVCTSGTRPGSPVAGMLIYETDTARHMKWTGAAWTVVMTGLQAYVPTFTGVTLGNGTVVGNYTRFADNVCWFYAELIYGTTSTGTCTAVNAPFNVSPSSMIGQWHRWSGNNNNIGGFAHGFGGSSAITFMFVTSTTNNADQTLTLASTDHLIVTGTFYAV